MRKEVILPAVLLVLALGSGVYATRPGGETLFWAAEGEGPWGTDLAPTWLDFKSAAQEETT